MTRLTVDTKVSALDDGLTEIIKTEKEKKYFKEMNRDTENWGTTSKCHSRV